MKVLKFGGASAGSLEAIKNLIDIVGSSKERLIVVSAFSGVTDDLIRAARMPKSNRAIRIFSIRSASATAGRPVPSFPPGRPLQS